MTYPYNPKIAPTIGNGLGGFPQKAAGVSSSVTASTKSYPLKLTPVGSSVTRTSTGGNFNGRVIFLTEGIALFAYAFSSAYYLMAIKYGSTGAISFSSPLTHSGYITDPLCNFNGAAIFGSNTLGQLNKVTSNGTTVSLSQLVLIPTSGTLTAGGSYTTLTKVNGFISSDQQPVCFDENGNLVILYRVTISGVFYLTAFVIDVNGTIVTSKTIISLPTTGSIQYDTTFEIRKTKVGYILVSSQLNTNLCIQCFFNVTSNFVATQLNRPADFSRGDGSVPNKTTLFMTDDVAMVYTRWDTAYAQGWGLLRDSNGNCIGQTTNEYATMASFPFVQQSYDIENKLYYSGQSLRFPLAEANNSLLGIASVFSEDGICYNQGALAATFYPNLVTSIITESEVNGVSTVSIGYMSKGYWLSVWFVQTINVVRAKLYKES
jgi:hypothetical protein